MEKRISVIIPNYNGAKTIAKCLAAAYESNYENFEVVVIDDFSMDNSVEIIERYPCKLIRLDRRSGTSKARNTGALNCSGEIIFFTDADCLLQPDTLSIINRAYASAGPDVVMGGTYTAIPYDKRFCSVFQSVFVNYSETKELENPDYIAAHAMIMNVEIFKKSGGFPEVFMPIIEDIEFSHRLKRLGVKLRMNADIQVRHIFDFSLSRSLRNAYKKTMYWVMYSQKNKDLLTDSGCASVELKYNVFSCFLNMLLVVLYLILQYSLFLYVIPLIVLSNTLVSRKQIEAFYRAKGVLFAGAAYMYYSILYPLPIGLGTISGVIKNYLAAD